MTAENRKGALVTLQKALETNKGFLQQAIPTTMAKTLTPERVTKIVLNAAATKGSKILECTVQSIMLAVSQALQLGLEPGGPLGRCYLVPFFNGSTGKLEAQLQIGYRGLIDLAHRSGELKSVAAYVVRENDHFVVELGTEGRIEHRPCLTGIPGEMKAVYCVAKFVGGGEHLEFMSRAEVERIRDNFSKSVTKSGNAFGPWAEHFDEMAKKTVVKRAAKYWPMSVELIDAIAADIQAEQAMADSGKVIDMAFDESENSDADAPGEDTREQPASNMIKAKRNIAKMREALEGDSPQEAAPKADEQQPPVPDANDANAQAAADW